MKYKPMGKQTSWIYKYVNAYSAHFNHRYIYKMNEARMGRGMKKNGTPANQKMLPALVYLNAMFRKKWWQIKKLKR